MNTLSSRYGLTERPPVTAESLVAQAKRILDHGDDAPSWLAAFDLCRDVIDLHGRGADHPLKTGINQ